MDIGTMWHCSLATCIPPQSTGLFFGCPLFCYFVSLCISFTNRLLSHYSTMMFATIIGIFVHGYLFWPTHLGFLKLVSFGSATTHLPGCVCTWTFSDWILDWTCLFRILLYHVWFFTRVFYRRGQGFATDCPCGVWCHGLSTCFLYFCPLVENLL